ncbi:phosphonate metabolism protein/1,5-bisphosphokinase (PRPP-forming) PhnN [Mycolicibacterium mengxianglii]|uniref:phosphonate metabolism protein/1,5-bisphosphokinase (PRPP-forming) PhnN n=1 Tax=Mycolicibacterium mengxianglii TaxID=2736649 RepID=UPI0018EF0198|nr:phosphonate metabolism protein/1,5-bisphosphokinase (PRPP-forming) PhnN [Mycolicibacterium mengxianglii]
MTGTFVAVVGPSGAGKDSVLDVARKRFAADPSVVFPRRIITRPYGPGEDHRAVTIAEFAELAHGGAFALTWRAHGLDYGIGVDVATQVADGAVAVVNVSRTVLADLPQQFPRFAVVRVTVSEEVRRARLTQRGREDHTAVRARLARPDPAPDHAIDLEIVNDGTVEEAGARLAGFVRRLWLGQPASEISIGRTPQKAASRPKVPR